MNRCRSILSGYQSLLVVCCAVAFGGSAAWGYSTSCQVDADCVRTGCSGQICASEPAASTCEFLPYYGCYNIAEGCRCNYGTCSWTPEVQECVTNFHTASSGGQGSSKLTLLKLECNDGIDNDGDGKTDKDDRNCWDMSCSDRGLKCPDIYHEEYSESPNKTQCSDGLDNDGDGGFDALVEISPHNSIPYELGKVPFQTYGNPFTVRALVNERRPLYKNSYVEIPDTSALYGDNATALKVCQIAGYRELVSWSCSSNQGGGCIWDSPHDNLLHRWDGSKFVTVKYPYGKKWISIVNCKGKIPECNDGIDNDGDGRTDSLENGEQPWDYGCRSMNDDSERAHDVSCTSPKDLKEKTQCSDGIDNDGDGVEDAVLKSNPCECWPPDRYDQTWGCLAVCWTPPHDPGCSSPQDDFEGDGTTQCQDGIDNDGDGLIDGNDQSCWGLNGNSIKCNGPGCAPTFSMVHVPTLNNEAEVPGECYDGKDNDQDGLIDAKDPGCINYTSFDSTPYYNPLAPFEKNLVIITQCSDGIDNDGDGAIDLEDVGCFLTGRSGDNEDLFKAECQDGKDNDGDGKIDLADLGCLSSQDSNESDDTSGPPSAPQNLSASDGGSADAVRLTWSATPRAQSYQLYRSRYSNEAGEPLGEQTSGLSYDDVTAVPGVVYYYSVVAINSDGQSPASNVDSGYRASPGKEPDRDGDGVSDSQENIDGTDVDDAGSFQLHLQSPAFSKYNTFLKQWNFLELIASGTRPISASVSVYLLDGRLLAQTNVLIQPQNQSDIDINTLIANGCRSSGMCAGYSDIDASGLIDTYGVVRIDFNGTEAGATLMGRMSNYRQDADGQSYSFAFAKELRNPTRGVTYAAANTFDPQASGFMVPNWLEIVNLNGKPNTFTYRLYNQQGTKVYETVRTVAPLGEADIQAGHEIRTEGVYLAEVIPHDGAADYFATVSRYSSNSPAGIEPSSYNFAFALEGRAGNGSAQFATISNQAGGCYTQTNWLEVANVRDNPVNAVVEFRSKNGSLVGSGSYTIAPKAQFHFNASALLPKGEVGSAQVSSNIKGSLVSQSLVYFHDCQLNRIQTAYASHSRIAGRDVQAGTVNTFLGMDNQVRVVGTSLTPTTVGAELRTFDAASQVKTTQFGLANKNTAEASTSASSTLATAKDRYGALTLITSAPNLFMAEVLRVRNQADGRVDFAMPTAVQ